MQLRQGRRRRSYRLTRQRVRFLQMKRDCFDTIHPTAAIIYFGFALAMPMLLLHPMLLGISFLSALAWTVQLNGMRDALRFFCRFILPLMLLTAILNPIFNHKGLTVLFYLKRNPVTLESVAYGAASGVMLGSVLLIFSCFNRIITDDKILYLFGKIIPSLAVVLSMALRFVPLFTTQAKKIALAQRCSDGDPASKSIVKRAKSGLFIFSALITWALESAVTTADSMRARGFGLHPRSFYTDFRFDGRDTVVSLFLAAGIAIFGTAAGCGKITVTYFPKFRMNPASPLFIAACIAYALTLLIPVIMNIKESVAWHYSKSKI